MPYESPYAAPKPAAPANQGLRRRLPAGSVPLAKKKDPKASAGGLLGGAVDVVKKRKQLLDEI